MKVLEEAKPKRHSDAIKVRWSACQLCYLPLMYTCCLVSTLYSVYKKESDSESKRKRLAEKKRGFGLKISKGNSMCGLLHRDSSS